MTSPESVMVLLSCQLRVIHLLFWNPLWDSSSSSSISSGSGNDSSSGEVVVVARSSRKDDSIMQMAFRENFTLQHHLLSRLVFVLQKDISILWIFFRPYNSITFQGKNFVAACLQRNKKRELRVKFLINFFQNRAGLRGYSVHCKRSWEGSCTCAK